jgi:uncharacterized hydrophobic protein (TIGR00271 family)
MLHARVVAPADLAPAVIDHLAGLGSVINLTHFPGAARKPDGDLILFDVAREDASAVVEALKEHGCATRGSIALTTVELSVSDAATRAEALAVGSGADAVVWDDVLARTSDSAELTFSFLAFMTLAALIAAVGILTDSLVLIIGAMVVGPEFGPLAGLCVALVQRRADLAARSAWALLVGFAISIIATLVFVRGMVLFGLAAPTMITVHPQTLFISRPDAWAGVIALLAGVAGMLSLTTSKPGALIGVFISVTTIPAAANMGVAAAYGQTTELRGAAIQLGLNILTMVVAGIGTLLLQRVAYARRRRHRISQAS